ncbi:MAG TPA: TPM domain-containing protein [Verrucomicrobiae bacterium]|nr:TPM domain-containing protein [Verrucomicrobiae bacterium]
MKDKEFIKHLHDEPIVTAIRAAEAKTSGEIRVFISRREAADPLVAAQQEFARLGMTNTAQRNGVLIFVAPRSRKFAILGDQGVHEKCGEAFWRAVAEEMTAHFRKSEFTQGIVSAIQKAGTLLGEHFPRRTDDKNELPDAVERD